MIITLYNLPFIISYLEINGVNVFEIGTWMTTEGCAFIASIRAIIVTIAFPVQSYAACGWTVHIKAMRTRQLVRITAFTKNITTMNIIKNQYVYIYHKIMWLNSRLYQLFFTSQFAFVWLSELRSGWCGCQKSWNTIALILQYVCVM